jgi:copper transport protein
MTGTYSTADSLSRCGRRNRGSALRLRRLLVFLVTFGLPLLAAGSAQAHAVLKASDPPANATVEAPPRQIVLRFSEAIDPAFSGAVVLDREGRRRSSPAAVSPDPALIAVPLDRLNEGIYIVRWRVLSSVDGHTTSGALVFGVGQAVPGGVAEPEISAPSLLQVAARWGVLVAAMLLAGTTGFPLLVLSKATLPSVGRDPLPPFLRSLRPLQLAAGTLLLVSSVTEFGLGARSLLDAPLGQALAQGTLWSLLTGTRGGWGLLGRLAAGLLLMLPASRGGRIVRVFGLILMTGFVGLALLFGGPESLAGSGHILHLAALFVVAFVAGARNALGPPPRVDWVPVLPAAALLTSFTIASHAAGRGVLAGAVDWAHLAAASIWVGGLPVLLFLIASTPAVSRPAFTAAVVPRFSRVAGYCLGVLLVTGVYSSWLHVPAVRAFVATAYGRVLLVKLGFAAGLAVLGAVNRFVLRPRLAHSETLPPAARWLARSLGGEVVIGAALLLTVSILTVTPPATVATPEAPPLALTGLTGGFRVDLTITTLRPGWSRYEVAVHADNLALSGEALLLLRFVKLDEDLRPVTVRPVLRSPGQYVAEGGELALPGMWEAAVVIRRAGRPDAVTSFPILTPGAPAPADDAEAMRLLGRARAVTGRLKAWRERQELTTGPGEAVVTDFAVRPPDRLRYRTSTGAEAIIIGADRWTRDAGGRWEHDTLLRPVPAEGPLSYLNLATRAARGRQDPCAGERCQVVLWEGAGARFAGWIGLSSGRAHRLMMVAPAHFMTLRWSDFNAPITIAPP